MSNTNLPPLPTAASIREKIANVKVEPDLLDTIAEELYERFNVLVRNTSIERYCVYLSQIDYKCALPTPKSVREHILKKYKIKENGFSLVVTKTDTWGRNGIIERIYTAAFSI
jgi:hypothetical protein